MKITTNISFFKRKLNQVTHLKGNHLDEGENQSLGIKDGFMDISFIVTHLGIRSLILGQAFGMKEKYRKCSISSSTWLEIASIFGGRRNISQRRREYFPYCSSLFLKNNYNRDYKSECDLRSLMENKWWLLGPQD